MTSIDRLSVPQNLTSLAYESIKRYILEAQLDDETRLTEEFLSTRLGISKSPVREALNSLHTEGLIRIEPRRGAFLRRFTVKEAKDLYDLREALEVHAIAIAVITPQLLSELRASVKRSRSLAKAQDKTGHIEEDTHFHGLLAQATGNAELCRVLANIQNRIWLCRCRTYDLSGSTAVSAHLSILEALQANDRTAAMQSMSRHICLVRDRLIRFLSGESASTATTMEAAIGAQRHCP